MKINYCSFYANNYCTHLPIYILFIFMYGGFHSLIKTPNLCRHVHSCIAITSHFAKIFVSESRYTWISTFFAFALYFCLLLFLYIFFYLSYPMFLEVNIKNGKFILAEQYDKNSLEIKTIINRLQQDY